MLLLFLPVVGGFQRRDGAAGAGIGSAHFHPGDKVGHLLFGQRLAGGHFKVFVGALNDLDEQAFFRLAGDDGGDSAAAAFSSGFGRIEIEAAFGLL